MAANFFRAINNLQNNVAVKQSMQQLSAQCAGATCALGMGFMGSASVMSFTSLVLIGTQISHELVHRHQKLVNGGKHDKAGLAITGGLPSAMYLSLKEWRALTEIMHNENNSLGFTQLNQMTLELLKTSKTLRTVLEKISHHNTLTSCASILWPEVPRAMTDAVMFSDINKAHDFFNEKLSTTTNQDNSLVKNDTQASRSPEWIQIGMSTP